MKYAIKVPVSDDGWLYVTEIREDGNRYIATYDTFEEAEKYAKLWNNDTVVECQYTEAERLRAKKRAIKEELYDEVKMEMFKASSKLEGIDYELPYSTRKEAADEKIGKWLSAALEDPTTCGAMKDDINEWFMAIEEEIETLKLKGQDDE